MNTLRSPLPAVRSTGWSFLIFILLALWPATGKGFIHPGGLHSQADLDRMRAKVAAGESPWIEGWNQLLVDTAGLLGYSPRATANMGSSRQNASRDAHAAYNAVIRWYVSGDTAYADKAVQICNAWSAVVNQVPTGTDIPGLSGIPIGEFAQVAEILRLYPGWAAADFERFKTMMLTYWYPVCHDFLTRHNNTCDTYYWANWDLCNMTAILAIGVLCDDQEKFDEAIAYLQSGLGNGNIWRVVPTLHPNGLGQWQESGRDQEHAQLGVGLLASMCEIAWKQGVDLYGYAENRLLAGAEYVARTNLSLPVPYTPYNNCVNVNQYFLSINGIGRIDDRPIWEMIYNHYVVRKGLSAPNVAAMARATRPEHGSADHFGYGTLTFTLDGAASAFPATAPAAVTNLTAEACLSRVELKWTPPADATTQGYEILRATSPGGPYTTIASWSANTWPQYWDWDVTNGTTYYYVVSPQNQAGLGTASPEVSATPLGATATMPAGWAHRDVGTVLTPGSASYSSAGDHSFVVTGSGSTVDGTADSVAFTSAAASGDVTFVARVTGMGGALGKTGIMIRESLAPDAPMILIKRGDVGWRQAAVAIRASAGANTTWVAGNDYTWTPTWFKLQRAGNTFTTYQSNDGVDWTLVTSASVTMGPSCYVGFAVCTGSATGATGSGTFDHVTVTSGGTTPAAPAALSATGTGSRQIDLTWSAVSGASAYTVKRAPSGSGPFTVIASNLSGNSFSDTGLEWQTTYHYVVSAGNVIGESPDSAATSATTLAPDAPPAPQRVAAVAGDARVLVSWNPATDATGYTVKRATTAGGPYSTLASVTGTDYHDLTAANGTTYYYVVSAENYVGASPDSAEVSATPAPGAYSYWPFNEADGTTAADVWAGRDATLAGGASFVTGAVSNGVDLNGTASGYVTLPAGVVSSLADFTIAAWVKLDTLNNWARLFDFGTPPASGNPNNYMFLSPRGGQGGNGVRYAIRTPSIGEQSINGPALPAGSWVHLALTQTGTTAVLYVNGAEVGRNSAMTLNPSSLGATTQNWIGKSQWPDPLLNGIVDDFRIYHRSLSAAEIAGIFDAIAPDAPTDLAASGTAGNVALAWTSSAADATYTVRRATSASGPFAVLASNLATTAYTDETAVYGAFYYTVTATSGGVESPPSAVASIVLPPAVPAAPVASAWDGRVDLSWTPSAGATGYELKRAAASEGPFATIASLTGTSYRDTALANGTTYHYVVAATNAAGTSADSAPASATPNADPVRDAFAHQDIGSVGLSGNAGYADGVFTLHGSGADIWGNADGFQFLHQSLTGDGAIVARVLGIDNTHVSAKAGVMMRDTLAANARHATADLTPNNAVEFIRRVSTGGGSSSNATSGLSAPRWVRLVRSGSSFSAYQSADGLAWTAVGGAQTITMGATLNVGLVVTSHNNGALAKGRFDHVNVASVTPEITSETVAAGTYGAPFSYAITATAAPYLYTAAGLPPGLTLDAETGVISGTPTAAGAFSVSLGAVNAWDAGSATLMLTIAKAEATIALDNLVQAYDGLEKTVTVTTSPADLTVNLTYDGGTTPPVYPGAHDVVATIDDPNYAGTVSDTLLITVTALVRHAPTFDGMIDGSVQVTSAESMTLNGESTVSGDLLVPGTPAVQLNGSPTVGGVENGPGSATPTSYTVTVNGGAVVRYIVRRVDAIALPTVGAPPKPTGTRSVTLTSAGQSIGNPATLKNLTLNGGAGEVAVPPGTYGSFAANGDTGFVFGVEGATEPAVYNLQGLTLNGSATLRVVGPVTLTLASGLSFGGTVGTAGHPEWLTLRVASGGVTLNTGATLHGTIVAPAGTVTIGDSATVNGTLTSDRLNVSLTGVLDEPAF